jgi:hypothetical protein
MDAGAFAVTDRKFLSPQKFSDTYDIPVSTLAYWRSIGEWRGIPRIWRTYPL